MHKMYLQGDFLVLNWSVDFSLPGPYAVCHRTALPSQSSFISCSVVFYFVSMSLAFSLRHFSQQETLEIKDCVSRSSRKTIFVISCPNSGLSAECFQSKFNSIERTRKLDFRFSFDLLNIFHDPGTCTYIISFCHKNL